MAKRIEEELIDVSEQKLEQKLEDFSKLMHEINNLPEKQRALWKEAYENALADRHNAFMMFRRAVSASEHNQVPGSFSSTELAIHGKTIAIFLEKMSKANDQLLRLAEMIGKAVGSNDDPPDWNKLLK